MVMVMISRYSERVLRFHQWSRKAYAIFSSLGKVVVIGRVDKTITEASLVKVTKYKKRGCSGEQHGTRVLIDDGSPGPWQQPGEIIGGCLVSQPILFTATDRCREQITCTFSSTASHSWGNQKSNLFINTAHHAAWQEEPSENGSCSRLHDAFCLLKETKHVDYEIIG